MILGVCTELFQEPRFLKQHLNPFCSLNDPDICVLGTVQIVELTEWVEILFERLEFSNKVFLST